MQAYSSQLFIPTHDKLSVNTEHESGSVSDRSCFCLWSLTQSFSRKTYFAQCSDICCCMSVRIRAWPGSRHSCLVYPPWHYLAVRSYFCHVEFQISIMTLGNASLTTHSPRRPNCTCYLWQKQRWKSERWPKIQSQHHRCRCCDQQHTTAPHNYHLHIKWWHTHCLSMLAMTGNS